MKQIADCEARNYWPDGEECASLARMSLAGSKHNWQTKHRLTRLTPYSKQRENRVTTREKNSACGAQEWSNGSCGSCLGGGTDDRGRDRESLSSLQRSGVMAQTMQVWLVHWLLAIAPIATTIVISPSTPRRHVTAQLTLVHCAVSSQKGPARPLISCHIALHCFKV